MEAVVIAVPLEAPPARLGERFTLREGTPLRVGPGREARLRLGPLGAGDLLVGTHLDAAFVRATNPPLRASLSGRELHGAGELPVRAGDSLYVHPGLVLEFRDAAPPKAQRNPELEKLQVKTERVSTPALDRQLAKAEAAMERAASNLERVEAQLKAAEEDAAADLAQSPK